MKEKLRLYFDAMLYGDSLTKRYLYGIFLLTLGTIVLSLFAIFGQGFFFGLGAVFLAITDLIWWQSMSLTVEELEKQGDKEAASIKKVERVKLKKQKIIEKKKQKALQKEIKGVKKRQDKLDKSEEEVIQKKPKKNTAYATTESEVKYILKKSRVKKDHREVMIERYDSLGLTETPAYLWKDRKKFYLLILDDDEPIKLDFPLSYDTVLTHISGVKSNPSKEYQRFSYPSFISMVFEPFLPDYYEKSSMNGTDFCKNLYRLNEDIFFTNTSAKNILEITGASFKVADEVTKESRHGEDFVNVYKANILWRDGVLSANEYKDRVTELLSNLAKADVGSEEFQKILSRMYEYNLITKAYVEFYMQYRKKYRAKKNKD